MSAIPNPRPAPRTLSGEEELRAVIPAPTDRIRAKIQARIDPAARSWIEAATLVGIAATSQGGWIFHIGDGAACVCDQENYDDFVVSRPPYRTSNSTTSLLSGTSPP